MIIKLRKNESPGELGQPGSDEHAINFLRPLSFELSPVKQNASHLMRLAVDILKESD